jgi:5'-nucleotidase
MTRSLLSLLLALPLALAVACGGDDGGTTDTGINDAVVTDTPEDVPATDTTPDVATDEGPVPIDWDAFFAPRDWTDDGKKRVVILHTNDMHSFVSGLGPLADYSPDWLNGDGTVGGFARLASLIERERRDPRPGASVLTVDAGDFTFGTAFAYLSRTVGLELHLMEAMGYDGATLGNHEMDWSPAGTAQVVDNGLADDAHLRILASNLVFDDEDAADDDLAALVGDKILPYRVLTLDNGLKVGLFGLLGTQAITLAPHAEPVTVSKPATAAQAMVDKLRNDEGVDLVVGLSHGGVGEGSLKGEDEQVAAAVTGLDVLVTGHSHTLLTEAKKIGTTLVVQAGNYGKYLGKLTIVEDGDGFALESWEAVPVDDTVPGLPEILETVAAAEADLDDAMFAGMDYGYQTPIATTGFDLMPVEFAESGLGDLVADAVRWATTQHDPEGPVQVVFEANGVIRDGIRKGRTGVVRAGDLVQILPLGLGPDHDLGYPMLAFYLTPAEIKSGLEVIVGLAPVVADSFFLQVSGLKFEYDPNGGLLDMVKTAWLGDEVDGWDATPLDLASTTQLIRCAANLYIAQMLGVVSSFGIDIVLKDKDGNPIENLEDAIVDADADAEGVQELKLWRTLIDYLRALPAESGALPAIPDRYAAPLGRMKPLAQ